MSKEMMKSTAKLPRKFTALALALSLFLSLSLSLPPPPARAGNASLFFSPTSGTQNVGTTFSVSVRVNSGSYPTNAYKAVITFPADKLSVASLSTGSSICTLWIPPAPNYSNRNGTVNFECGHPGTFGGSSGTIGNITFSVNAPGSARLIFYPNSSVKAADGAGTEVLDSTGSAIFDLQPPLAGVPTVSSSTHPDQNAWYQTKRVELSWPTPDSADRFSYTLDQNDRTTPDNVSEGSETAKAYPDLSEGIYYFHLKRYGSLGWGETTHFRIQIDTTPPDPFEVTSEPPAENVISAPLIGAAAVDRPSGVGHYEIALDGGDFEEVKIPYKFELIREGKHTLTVRAVDHAGNYRDSSLILYVIDIEDPQIAQPADGTYLPILENLVIKGTAPVGLVKLYLNGELIAQVESDGDFEYTHTAFLNPGSYKLTAIAVTGRGIASSPAKVTFTVDPRAVKLFGFTLPGWLVYGLLLGIIVTLLIFLFRYFRKVAGFDKHVRKDVDQIEEEAKRDFDRAEKEIEQAVEDTLADLNESQIHQLEHELERKIEDAEGKALEKLEAELNQIRRHHPQAGRRFRFPKIRIPQIDLIFWKRKRKKEEKEEAGSEE